MFYTRTVGCIVYRMMCVLIQDIQQDVTLTASYIYISQLMCTSVCVCVCVCVFVCVCVCVCVCVFVFVRFKN